MQLITFFNALSYNIARFEEEDAKKKAPEMPDPLAEKFIKTRQILLSGEINKDLAEKIVRQLLVLEADDSEKPIYMYIDSPGGDVDAGFAIFDMIRFIKSPVILIGMGLIASAAALILLAVDKENRVALPNSRYLIHQPSSGMRGVATDIEIHAKEMEKTKKPAFCTVSSKFPSKSTPALRKVFSSFIEYFTFERYKWGAKICAIRSHLIYGNDFNLIVRISRVILFQDILL